VITGGAVKLTHKMEERTHTREELIKLEKGRNFLILKWFNSPTLGSETTHKVHLIHRGLPRGCSLKENVFDSDGLADLIEFQL
jgi:hypothetical protein